MKRLTHTRRATDNGGMPAWVAYAIVFGSLLVLGFAGWIEGGMK